MKIILQEITGGGDAEELSFDTNVIRIGRETSVCQIVFESERHPMVSRSHAELRWDDGKWYIVDLGSSYGTYLDGVRVNQPTRVRAGQTMQFGEDGPQVKVVWFEVIADSFAPAASEPVPTPVPVVPPSAPVQQQVPPKAISASVSFEDEPQRPRITLSSASLVFGRDPSCDAAFSPNLAMVSRRHASIRLDGERFIVEDNGSFNGTFVNEQRIATPTPLYHNDLIRFGIGGPVVRFDSPTQKPPEGAEIAGQRSLDAEPRNRTMVFKADDLQVSLPGSGSSPQLLMSIAFGDRKELTIGRSPENDITLDGLQISSRHARLLRSGSETVIDDVGSTNGVYLNGNRISRSSIMPGDVVRIGSFEIRVDAGGSVGVFDSRSKTRIDAVAITKDVNGGRLRLLDNISLTIQPNEFVGLLGPSGAGKSTLMDALNGMRPASSGNVFVNDLDLYRHLDSIKQSIGYVPQDDIIHRELTVYRTLYYVAKLRLSRDVTNDEVDRTIDEVLDVTGLTERRDVPISQLSGGQRKRVSIAVELITKPSIIFLDEPTSGLDPGTEEKIMRLFRQIAESGRTVVLTTHAMENVKLFDKIVVLMRGRLVYYGPPQDALTHLGAANFKELFDKLEAPVEAGVRKSGEHVRSELTEQTADQWRAKYAATPHYAEFVAKPQASLNAAGTSGVGRRSGLGIAGSIRQWLTLSRRYFEVLLKDKMTLFILMAQAPLIALLTHFALGNDLPRDLGYFVLALVSIWFGTSVSAREIIREKPVYTRERMVNLGLLPYLGSKMTVLGFIVAIQCVLLFVPLKFFDVTGMMPLPGEFAGIPQFWAMLLTSSVGIALGLLVSALVRTSEMATSMVPLILIPQILLSGIFGVPSGISKPASMFIPAAWSFDTMKRYSTLDTLEPEGSAPSGPTKGQGLFNSIEAENDKLIADARKDLEDYRKSSQRKLDDLKAAANRGETPTIPTLDEPPAIPAPKKLPSSLGNYITFLHPWMNEILNQFVLMLMFGMFVIATLIVLRLKDVK